MTLAVAVVLSVLAQAAQPEGRPRVWLGVDGCIPVSPEEVRRILGIELHAALESSAQPSADATAIRVTCQGPYAALHVEDPVTGKSLDRAIELPVSRKARPRLLALAVTELVTASWTEAETNPEPEVAPVGRTASLQARQEARAAVEDRQVDRERHAVWLAALLGARGSSAGPLYGGGAALRYEAWSWGGVDLDLMAHYGQASAPLGSIAETNGSVGVAVHAQWLAPRYVARLGAGGRGGPVWFVGQPYNLTTARGTTLLAAWAGPMISASVDVPVGKSVALEACLEGGYVVRPVNALNNGAPGASVDGFWGAMNVGVSWGI
jgi:hypothetical protein